MSGTVSDEGGAPVADARVNLEYPAGGSFSSPAARCSGFGGCYISMGTDAAGAYQPAIFEPGPQRFFTVDVAGLVWAWRDGYAANIQLLSRVTSTIRQNFRLRRIRAISAGQSFDATVEPDSSMCTDLEDWFVWTHRCESIGIAAQGTGTLVVDAREGTGGGPLPLVFFATSGNYTTLQNIGTGVVSVGVTAGQNYTVFVGAPVGMPTQRYNVSTAIR